MATKNFILHVPLASISSAAVTASYQAINSGGLPNACHGITITNDSNQDVTVSFDGTNDHDYLPAGESLTINTPPPLLNGNRAGTVVSVKGTAGTGNVYLAGSYLPQ